MGRKYGGLLCPFRRGGAGSLSNKMWPGQRSIFVPSGIFIHPSIWPQRYRPKIGGSAPFWGGVAGSPSSTLWPGPRPVLHAKFYVDPSNRLATVHQCYEQDRTDRTDRDRQQSDSIGRTVLLTVAQKRSRDDNYAHLGGNMSSFW